MYLLRLKVYPKSCKYKETKVIIASDWQTQPEVNPIRRRATQALEGLILWIGS